VDVGYFFRWWFYGDQWWWLFVEGVREWFVEDVWSGLVWHSSGFLEAKLSSVMVTEGCCVVPMCVISFRRLHVWQNLLHSRLVLIPRTPGLFVVIRIVVGVVVRASGPSASDLACLVADPPRSLYLRGFFGLGYGVRLVCGRELFKGGDLCCLGE